ncbi:protein SpAN [Penaeus vannamei]|uniref:protein SpAN n=1 Tax=Penaeus vannamei TaxID=6689 RepID=UPI00387F57A4
MLDYSGWKNLLARWSLHQLPLSHQLAKDPKDCHSCELHHGLTTHTQLHLRNLMQKCHVEVFHDDHDFMLTPEQQAILHGRKASSNLTAYWSDDGGFPLIPFAFYDAYVNRYKVWMAILEWKQATCINLMEVSTGYSGPHLKIQRHADDCRSFIGMVSTTGQDFYISEDCENQHGELLHLLGYAIGFWPEETRSDRNHYVQINNDNVLATVVDNFPLNSDNNYSVPFDYCSIMFHHERAFTNNGGITIATLDPLYQGVLGQRSQMSHMDKLLANTMYQCADKLLSKCSLGSDPCSNSGYLDKSCSCICPDGTSGTYCDTVTSAYNGYIFRNYNLITDFFNFTYW